MAPFKSSLARSGKKLLGFFNQSDLSLRGATQISRMPPPPFEASGGTKIPASDAGNGYSYHVFLYGTSDNFVVNSGSKDVEVLIVAGGGGGAWSYYSGGGGGGGCVTALGGGGGFGGSGAYPDSASGGSGGGAHGYPADGSASIVKAPQPVPGDFTAYGNNGGLGTPYAGGGGGGAGAAGGPAVPRGPNSPGTYHFGGLGGNGRAFPAFPAPIIAPAIPTTNIPDAPVDAGGPGTVTERAAFTAVVGPTGLYAGGGGGGLYYTIGPDPAANGKPAGGTGGGADGAGSEPSGPQPWDIGPARDAVMHTGGGGGGGNYGANSFGTDGATGIVLVRYQPD